MSAGLSKSRWASATRLSNSRSTWVTSVHAPVTSSVSNVDVGNSSNQRTNTDGNGSPFSSNNQVAIAPTRAAGELQRFMQIVRRMRWKLPYLAEGYRQATAMNNDHVAPAVDPAARQEAELMFKLDFFEYYMLCERALVHLQGVFGITINRDVPFEQLRDGGETAAVGLHRYHANVLEALDREDNPLHGTLGSGEVRRQLARAKDLRNRWKNPDEEFQVLLPRGKIPGPLASYNLESILNTIFQGLDEAYAIAQLYVQEQQARVGAVESESGAGADAMDLSDVEDQWGFITDAMDWEAV